MSRTQPRADKLRQMPFLVTDPAQEEGVPLLALNLEFPD